MVQVVRKDSEGTSVEGLLGPRMPSSGAKPDAVPGKSRPQGRQHCLALARRGVVGSGVRGLQRAGRAAAGNGGSRHAAGQVSACGRPGRAGAGGDAAPCKQPHGLLGLSHP